MLDELINFCIIYFDKIDARYETIYIDHDILTIVFSNKNLLPEDIADEHFFDVSGSGDRYVVLCRVRVKSVFINWQIDCAGSTVGDCYQRFCTCRAAEVGCGVSNVISPYGYT